MVRRNQRKNSFYVSFNTEDETASVHNEQIVLQQIMGVIVALCQRQTGITVLHVSMCVCACLLVFHVSKISHEPLKRF